jgi:hypothetical protein
MALDIDGDWNHVRAVPRIKPYRQTCGKHWNEGARLSWMALRAKGWSQAELNRRLADDPEAGSHSGYANRILYGDQRPGLRIALLIQTLLGVPAPAWHQPAKADFSLQLTGAEAEALPEAG